MQIDTVHLIGLKTAEIAETLQSALFQAEPVSEHTSRQLNTVADLTCCALNALARAAAATTVSEFAEHYSSAERNRMQAMKAATRGVACEQPK